MVKANNKISNNLYFNVKGHFGLLNEVKESTNSFKSFYIDVIRTIKSVSDEFDLNFKESVALFMRYVQDSKFKPTKTGTYFSLKDVPEDVYTYIKESGYRQKECHAYLLKLILSIDTDALKILGELVFIKQMIRRDLGNINNGDRIFINKGNEEEILTVKDDEKDTSKKKNKKESLTHKRKDTSKTNRGVAKKTKSNEKVAKKTKTSETIEQTGETKAEKTITLDSIKEPKKKEDKAESGGDKVMEALAKVSKSLEKIETGKKVTRSEMLDSFL
jgi:hypothetical protein